MIECYLACGRLEEECLLQICRMIDRGLPLHADGLCEQEVPNW